MKHIVQLFVLVVIIFSAVGCHGERHSYNSKLLEAESLMETHPDSALSVLSGIDSTSLKSDCDKALFALLKVQACDRNNIPLSEGSLVSEAAAFYSKGTDIYHRKLSYYYLARAQENDGDYSLAVVNLLKASDLRPERDSSLLNAMIFTSLSTVFHKVYDNRESLRYAQKACDAAADCGKTALLLSTRYELAKAHYLCGDYEQCFSIIEPMIDSLSSEVTDSILLAESNRLAGNAYLAQHKFREARECYSKIACKYFTEEDCNNMGIACLETGDVASAERLSRYLEKVDSTQCLLKYLIAKKKGNYGNALGYLEKEYSYNDFVLDTIFKQSVSYDVANFKDFEARNKIEMERQSKIIAWFAVACLALLFVLLSALLCIHFKKQKRQMLDVIENSSCLQQDLKMKQDEADELRKSVDALFSGRFAYIEQICTSYYECHGTSRELKRIYSEAISSIDELRTDSATLKKLEDYVNTYKENAVARFKASFPDAKPADVSLFMYIVAGFSARTISVLLGEELPVVYNRKSRLKAKIRSLQTDGRDFLESVIS